MNSYSNWELIVVFSVGGGAFALGFGLIAVWAIRNDQFKDVEGVKYRMMDDFHDVRSTESKKRGEEL
ncbi:MAG: cbb3-type cytochrome oxidase assembly protein CcoS [Holophagaceae bacterium]